MLYSELIEQYPHFTKDGVIFTVKYNCSDIDIIYDEDGNIIDYELIDFELINTPEEVSKIKPTQQVPSEMEVLKQEVKSLKEKQALFEESQATQDFIIDDLVFEVIPSLETQIASDQSKVPTIIKRVNVLTKGMVQYLAKKISEGKDYEEVFKINAYKQYQEEVDKILGRK